MTKSHGHQQIALLDALCKRITDRKPGLSKQAMVLSYGFDSEEQLNHAIQALADAGALAIDIDGRFPSFRIFRKRLKAAMPLAQPLFLSSGSPIMPKDGAAVSAGWKDAAKIVGKAAVTPSPQPVARPSDNMCVLPTRSQIGILPVVKPAPTATKDRDSAVEAALTLETERDRAVPHYVSFRLPKEDFTWLLDEMERVGGALPVVARDMLLAEMDRRRSPDAAKHKISARVIRTAREEGLDLATFVTSLIEVGLTAREMNRRGI